jgi:hypothetical protein
MYVDREYYLSIELHSLSLFLAMLVDFHHIVSLKHEQSHNNHYYESYFFAYV